MKQYVYTKSVDYLRQKQKRQKLATYLRATNFRKIAGRKTFDARTQMRRRFLDAAALAAIITGIWFVLF